MTINEIQDEIIEEFALYDDWMDKYQRIVEIGKETPMIDDLYKTEDNLISGCQSKVWFHGEMEEDKLVFSADSDAIITRGLIGLIIMVLSGQTPEDIAHSDLYFIDKIGLHHHLSPSRSNGLNAMVEQMKIYAVKTLSHKDS